MMADQEALREMMILRPHDAGVLLTALLAPVDHAISRQSAISRRITSLLAPCPQSGAELYLAELVSLSSWRKLRRALGGGGGY